jgi:hypothetical protein
MSISEEADDPEALGKSLDKVSQLMETLWQALDALAAGVSFSAPDDVRQLLGLRASVVPYIDARLATCGDLLAEGLRGEALGRANESPPLIETAKLLDLGRHPNWPAWQQALAAEEMPEPVCPRVDLVKALEKAQADLQRLKPLLDAWRRMNLANGGLAERIAVLRRLRSADPANAEKVWKKALLEHEQQRLRQIEQEIKQATRDRDERQLETLVEEMSADWIEPVAPRLKKAAAAALESFRGSRIDRELEELAASLTAAHEARDLEAARELRRRWQPLADEKGPTDPGDLNLAAAAPAVAWVDRHDRMEALSGEIWQSLDGRPSGLRAWKEWVRSLDRMGGEMEDLAEKLPEEVDVEAIERTRQRIARKRSELEHHEAFRRRMMYIAAASAAILLAAGVFYYDSVRRYEKAVLAACEQLDDSLARCQAGTIVKQPDFGLLPAVLRDIRVVGRMEKLENCFAAGIERRQGFDAALAEAKNASAAAEGEERSDPLAPWPAAFAEATKAVARIGNGNESLAKSPTERAKLEEAKRLTAAADLEIERKVEAFDAELDKARGLLASDVAGGAATAAAIQANFDQLRARAGTIAAVGAELGYGRQQIASAAAIARTAADGPLGRKLADLQRMVGDRRKFASDLGRLPSTLGQWPAYREMLEQIATTFGDLPQAREFAEAAEQSPHWEAIIAWQAFAEGLGQLDKATPEIAKATVKAFGSLPKHVKNLPMARRFADDLLPALEVFSGRRTIPLKDDLSIFLEGPFMGEIAFVAKDEQGGLYYCLAPQPIVGQPCEYLAGGKLRNQVWPTKRSRTPVVAVEPAPQARLAKTFLGDVERSDISGGLTLDDLLLRCIKQAVADEKCDILSRVVIVRKFLLLADEFSRPIHNHGRELVAAVDRDRSIPGLTIEDLFSFLSPDRDAQTGYITARNTAKAILRKVEDGLPVLQQAITDERELLQQPCGEIPALSGLVSLAADGTPVPVWRGESPPAGTLWWISSTGELMEAGSLAADGGFRFSAPPPPAGTPLWRLVAE